MICVSVLGNRQTAPVEQGIFFMFTIERARIRSTAQTHSLAGSHPSEKPHEPLFPRPMSVRIYAYVGKRVLDVLLVLCAMPIVLPVVLFCAILVSLDGARPFYTQERVGRNGRIYTMWKLRSMVPNAKARLESYLESNPEIRAEWDSKQKLSNDPRITVVGRFLRKCSMDELPQLWNVLRGDMSLVGPRPMMPEQKTYYPGTDYYDLLPGITGSWQVSARNESTFAERAFFDTEYKQALSLREDLRILTATVRVVLRATGC